MDNHGEYTRCGVSNISSRSASGLDKAIRKQKEEQVARMFEATGAQTKAGLADWIEAPAQSISRGLKSGAFPALWFIKIADKTGVSLDWLIYGVGDKRRMRPGEMPDADKEEFVYVRMAAARLSAGDGEVVLSEELEHRYAFRKAWFAQMSTAHKDAILMTVRGDSMAPTLQDHDTVMVDRAKTRIDTGRLYAVNIGGDSLHIKRLEDRGVKVRVISDNTTYEPYDVDLADLRIIGQVVWFARQCTSHT